MVHVPVPEVTFVYADDWEGLYIGDELIIEGHSLDMLRVLDVLKVSYSYGEAEVCLTAYGRCPPSLKDVEFDEVV